MADRENLAPCRLAERIDALGEPPWGSQPPPWAPGRREEVAGMVKAVGADATWCMSEVDIFCDLGPDEMAAIADEAPMRTYAGGELIYTPHAPVEALFILKEGRVRVFRVATDGRALTTAIIRAGTIFGEMAVLGQQMYGNFAEALDEAVVCVMSQDAVRRLLLGDPRIAARITEILGRRLAEMERRLSESVFKSVPQRVASTLVTLATEEGRRFGRSAPVVSLTHEQVAALAGTSRETTTKSLGDFAARGLIKLGRGRIVVLDRAGLDSEAGG